MRRPTARPGYTLLELIVVIAALTIIGAVLLPTLSGLRRDTGVKAGADVLRAQLAEARGKAIETGLNYRLSISPDGKRVRVAPDLLDSQQGQLPDTGGAPATVQEETLPAGVTLGFGSGDPPPADGSGWVSVATVLTDGTCREDAVELTVSEPGVNTLVVRIRGLTGSSTVSVQSAGGNSR